jgi:hypothetical protein
MFHFMAYSVTAGINALNLDMTSVPDTIFLSRNSHFLFSEQWEGLAFCGEGTSLLRIRSNIPKINAIQRHHVFPINRAAVAPSPPNVMDLRTEPFQFSINEEIQWEVSNNLGAATEQENLGMWIGSPDWNMNFPDHIQRVMARATATPTGVANAWSVDVPLTFSDQNLRGGTYAMIGCQCFATGVPFFRFVFPRNPLTIGRLLRPGGISLDSINNVPWYPQQGGLGVWGVFHTVEPPTVMCLANAAGAVTLELRMDLLFLGEELSLLENWVNP